LIFLPPLFWANLPYTNFLHSMTQISCPFSLDFNAKVGRQDIFKPKIGNESSHEIDADNGVRVLNFAIPRIWLSKVHCFHVVMFIIAHLLMERLTIKFTVFW
jgi:hypothetical protein